VNDPATDIKEVNHAPNPDLQRVVHHVSADNDPITLYSLPYPDHEYMGVFEIKLQTGLIVALSLTGAQFAHVHEPVILWERYMAIYGTPDDRTLTRTSNGSAQRQHYKLLDTLEQVSHLHSDKVVLHHFEQLLTRPEVAKQLRVLNLLALAGPITWGRFNKQFISICSIGIAQIVYFLSPASTESNSSPILSLAHPSALQDSVFYAHKRHLRFYDFGGSLAQNFSWDRMKEVIKEKGPSLDVKREARDVLRNRSIMAPWQDGRLLFLPNQVLREDRAGTSWIVDNPHFNSRRRGL
jgi:hypothetical protein